MSDPREIVERGYDAIADGFAAWQSEIEDAARLERLDELLALLPERPDVLELGIGAGGASSRILAERGRLTGVDVSREQLRRARERLPSARLVRGSFTELELAGGSFDAVVAFYVLNHVPQQALGPLLESVAVWLRPGGLFLANFPTADNRGWVGEWLGTQMFFAGFAPATNRRLVEDAGLEVVREVVETMVEPEGEVRWQWLLARRGQGGAAR